MDKNNIINDNHGRGKNNAKEYTQPVDDKEKELNNRQIIIYLLVTFVLTFGMEIFVIMPMVGDIDINKAYIAQNLIAGVMFMPTIGALITRFAVKERPGGMGLTLALNLKGNLKYYGLVWFGIEILTVLGAALYFIIFPRQFDGEMGYARALLEAQAQGAGAAVSAEQVKQAVLVQIVMGAAMAPFANILTCFGEEFGWRGYLLPRLLNRFKVAPALVINGIIWGLWHIPLTIMGHNYGVGYRGFPFLGIFAMCVFCVVVGIILSFVTIRTKSVIPAVIGHGTLNGFASAGIYFTSLENPYNVFLGPAPTGLIGGAGFIAAAGILLYLLYKEEKQGTVHGQKCA